MQFQQRERLRSSALCGAFACNQHPSLPQRLAKSVLLVHPHDQRAGPTPGNRYRPEFPHFCRVLLHLFPVGRCQVCVCILGQVGGVFIAWRERSGLLPVLEAQRRDVGNKRRRKKGHKTKEQGGPSPHAPPFSH